MASAKLPYEETCPVIYDNDDHRDVYTDEYLLALASAGQIDLRGFITTTPSGPDNRCVPTEDYEAFVAGRAEIVAKAGRSGMRNLPRTLAGPSRRLERPGSGEIEDTAPFDTAGSRLVVEEAKKASSEKPLVLTTGGPLTVAADAYLLDPSIAESLVVSSLLGTVDSMSDYNGGTDPWAAYIVLQRLRYVQFPAGRSPAYVPKARLPELPDTELRRWMIGKHHPTNELPAEHDHDGQPVVSLVRPDYVRETRSVVFGRFTGKATGIGVPAFVSGGDGRAIVVTDADGDVATEDFWRALKTPAAYRAAT